MALFVQHWSPNLLRVGLVPQEAAYHLHRLDGIFGRIREIPPSQCLTVDGVARRPEWEEVRSKAREILSLLGQTLRAPDLKWLARVPGAPPKTQEDANGLAMWETTLSGTPAVSAILYSPGVPEIGSVPYWIVAGKPGVSDSWAR